MPLLPRSLNLPTPAHKRRADEIVGQIRTRIRARRQSGALKVPYIWNEFERDIVRLLDTWMPQCALPGVRLFSPSQLGIKDYGFEIDNLLHITHEDTDYLVLIEVKNQKVDADGKDRWLVEYSKRKKNIIEQIDNHIGTILEYINPTSKDILLRSCLKTSE